MAEMIQKLQFKRGTKANLVAVLKGENRPAAGEPIWEMPESGATTNLGGKLKIGDGVKDYADLPYLSGDADDQKLIYDNIYEFPATGSTKTIYIVKDGNSYRWDGNKYVVLYVNNNQFIGLLLNEQQEIVGAERQIDGGDATSDYTISNFIYKPEI